MANAIATQVLVDGNSASIIKVTILGDGSGEEVATTVYDASAYTPAVTDNKLTELEFSTVGASAVLLWDATSNVVLLGLPADHAEKLSFKDSGGIINNSGAGKTGDVLITTTGLGSGDSITLILTVRKKAIPCYV